MVVNGYTRTIVPEGLGPGEPLREEILHSCKFSHNISVRICVHFYKTKWFLVSKQKTNFYLTVVEEPSNAVRCENDIPIVETFPRNSCVCR